MSREPTPREGVYDTYWRFAAERLAIMYRRAAGQARPWTLDSILDNYKFCNTFRAADRVSQYLIRDVCYGPTVAPADRAFQIVAFRMFSKPETWESLKQILGQAPTLRHLKDGTFGKALDTIKKKGHGLYTGAFILCANPAYGHSVKHRNHVDLFKHMFLVEDLGERITEADSLKEVYTLLHDFPLMGDFMSYQIAIDLNYSTLIDFSENDFTCPGPGALRGLKKVFSSLGSYSPEESIMLMVERQDQEFERLGLDFPGLWGRKLHAIDCQGLFCETDKYSRVAFPMLASARTRIKTRFRATSQPIRFFFPPKWDIHVPSGVTRTSAIRTSLQ